MKATTIALTATILSLVAMPVLACSGAKKSSMQQSSVSTPAGESQIIKTLKDNS